MFKARKLYFVRNITQSLDGTSSIHVLSLGTGVNFKAKLDPAFSSQSALPGATYQAMVMKRGRGVMLTAIKLASDLLPGVECKALADFLAKRGNLSNYIPLANLSQRLLDAATTEHCTVRELLSGRHNRLATYIEEPQVSNLLFAWRELQALQAEVQAVMAQGFDQPTSEKIVQCSPVGVAERLVDTPLHALPFLSSDSAALERHPTVLAASQMTESIGLLRYLEAQSSQGRTLLLIDEVAHFQEAVDYCTSQGWVAVQDGFIQLISNNQLQQALREALSRICTPFHPRFTLKEIDYAVHRLNAAFPDLFMADMFEQVSQATNSRVLLVRHDDIHAAIEFTQQFSAVTEVLSNKLPTLVTYSKPSEVYERELGGVPVPFYRVTAQEHAPALVVFQFNLLPVFEMYQLFANLGKVFNLVAMVDMTLPISDAIKQLASYFPTVDVHVRQQGALPLQRCFGHLADMEARVEKEDVNRIAVICDCPRLALHLNRRYSSVAGHAATPKKGDLIRLSPQGMRSEDDALVRIISVKQSELLVLQSNTYRSIKTEEFLEHSWHAAFALSPAEAMSVALPPVLVFTSAGSASGHSLVRNLQVQGVRVIEHCSYEIEGSPEIRHPGLLQRIVPLVE
jgi:hypothetical protein